MLVLNVHTERLVLPLGGPQQQDPAEIIESLWFRFTDFCGWEQWLPHVYSVVVLDTGSLSRGSRLQVNAELGTEIWQVSYWDAGRRIVFQISARNRRRACAVETRLTADRGIELVFDMEFELTGLRRWLRPVLARMYARRTRLYAENLRIWLQPKQLSRT